MSILLQIESALSSVDLPLPLLALLAGIISILSPCILPLLPAILAYSSGKGKFRPLAIVAGLIFTFTLMGMAVAAFSDILAQYQQYIRIVAEFVIISLGIAMLMEFNLSIFNRIPGNVPVNPNKEGVAGGFILGLSLGIVWIPCTGPILTVILMGVLLKGGLLYGGFLLFIYSMGLGIPMLMIAYFINVSGNRLSTISHYDVILKKVAGAMLILLGLWMVYSYHIKHYLIG
ncbi:MAG: cytochrome c biogenesis CcdA family protein [ANME-2 cluster archaeon]|nr:cytochrome c biogenesis CcdA family protein [ANME-2 cluster archaeon]